MMKFKTLMITKAIVCLGFGPLLLFFPGQLLNFLGTSFGPGAALNSKRIWRNTLWESLSHVACQKR